MEVFYLGQFRSERRQRRNSTAIAMQSFTKKYFFEKFLLFIEKNLFNKLHFIFSRKVLTNDGKLLKTFLAKAAKFQKSANHNGCNLNSAFSNTIILQNVVFAVTQVLIKNLFCCFIYSYLFDSRCCSCNSYFLLYKSKKISLFSDDEIKRMNGLTVTSVLP